MDCDPWWEPETEWHRKWKAFGHRTEVTIENHRADVVTSPRPGYPDGLIIELQHSSISVDDVLAREACYGNRLRWIFDGTNIADYALEIQRTPTQYRWKLPGGRYITYKVDYELVNFRWKHARKSYAVPSQRVYIDLVGDFLLRLESFTVEKGQPHGGRGHLIPRARVEGWLR